MDGRGAQDTDNIKVLVKNTDPSSKGQTSNKNDNLVTQKVITNPAKSNALENNTGLALLNAQRNNNINASRTPSNMIANGLAVNNQLSSSTVTTQAVLHSTQTYLTNNIVNTRTFYDVIFTTGSAGVVARIDVTFPSGTNIGKAQIIETSGIVIRLYNQKWSDLHIHNRRRLFLFQQEKS